MSSRIDPLQVLGPELRRILAIEIEKGIAGLSNETHDRGVVLHETRKRFKKLRAILRLVRSDAPDFYDIENARYRDLSASLAGGREASALVETVDRFLADFPRQTMFGQLDPVRDILAAARDRSHDQGVEPAIQAAIASCQDGLAALDELEVPDDPGEAAAILADGASSTVRAARKAMKRAARRGDAEDFHDLRKAVKRHWTQIEALGELWPEPVGPRRRQLKALGEALGELNDVAVMRSLLHDGLRGETQSDAEHAEADAIALDNASRLFAALLDRKEKTSRKRCLENAVRLFALRPKSVFRAIEAAWRERAHRPAPKRDLMQALVASG